MTPIFLLNLYSMQFLANWAKMWSILPWIWLMKLAHRCLLILKIKILTRSIISKSWQLHYLLIINDIITNFNNYIFSASITDENRFNKFLKELLEEFSCLNITELILNGISDVLIMELFSDDNCKSISNLQFLRLENAKQAHDAMDFKIKNNISKMVRWMNISKN